MDLHTLGVVMQECVRLRSLPIIIRNEQHDALHAIAIQNWDSQLVLPTGMGKSLVFQILPDVIRALIDKQHQILIMICPLISLQ